MTTRKITCPHCGGPSTLDRSNTHRPFCSDRCKHLDLGSWLDESYVIEGTQYDDLVPSRPVEEQ